MTHICVAYLIIIASDNGLSPSRHQAIIWTNAGILLIRPLGLNFSEILIEIHTFSFKKMHLKMSSAKRQPFCLGLNVLTVTSLPIFCAFSVPVRLGQQQWRSMFMPYWARWSPVMETSPSQSLKTHSFVNMSSKWLWQTQSSAIKTDRWIQVQTILSWNMQNNYMYYRMNGVIIIWWMVAIYISHECMAGDFKPSMNIRDQIYGTPRNIF